MEVLRHDFEEAALPHLRDAYRLARWLTRDDADAEDVVQEAYLRALKYFSAFHGGDGRAWLLAIVRNTSFTWKQRNRPLTEHVPFDESLHLVAQESSSPEARLISDDLFARALEDLPAEYREVIVMRELDGLSYREIAALAEIPVGTVMSRIARGRKRLRAIAATCRSRMIVPASTVEYEESA